MPEDGFRDLLAAIPVPLVLIDGQERISSVNLPGEALFGSGLEAMPFVAVLRQPALIEAVEQALAGGRVAHAQYVRSELERDETYRVLVTPVQMESGNGALVSFEDTTDLQRAEQMRRDFVANVSHELKTPLTALLGFIETLKGAAKDDPVARERFLNIMEMEAERMNRLVTDLLSLNRVESNHRVRPSESVDVREMIYATQNALRPMAEAKSVRFELIEDVDANLTIPGDRDQLVQVFTNLIENAIKYGGAGGIVTVSMQRHAKAPGFKDGFVQVDVIDQGDGFDPIHIPRLTERFYRVDSHRSRELGGTGLGLAIAKHILNRHRGRFRIKSAEGEGARFSVLLPIAP
jgi:two-component system phosphate regulon sensor histidine kinase PhoR